MAIITILVILHTL